MQPFTLPLYLIATFLVSGIPFGLLYVKIFHKKDVRTFGSGNIGATNVLRAAGAGIALLTAVSDILKSFIPVILARKFFSDSLFPYLVWMTAVLGHCFSPYLKLKGGKGVSTFFGGLLALEPLAALITFVIWVLVIAVSQYVSLGSMIASAVPFVTFLTRGATTDILLISFLLPLVIVYRHKDNIRRLLNKTENKLRLKQ
ncbi:MAG: glycerol-3-phosphate 1-O-acyltransferase PlsY [candidate division WOR-3 bacterium]